MWPFTVIITKYWHTIRHVGSSSDRDLPGIFKVGLSQYGHGVCLGANSAPVVDIRPTGQEVTLNPHQKDVLKLEYRLVQTSARWIMRCAAQTLA